MRTLTHFILRHRRLVIGAWLLITIAGGAVSSHVVKKLTYDYSMPGQPGDAAAHFIAHHFGTGGLSQPYVATVTYRDAASAATRAARSAAAFARLSTEVPRLRVVDYATTHNALFRTNDGRTELALVFYRYDPSPTATPPTSAIASALDRSVGPDGAVGLTSANQLANGNSSGGVGVLAESLIGALGAIIVLAFVFGSTLAVLPLLVAGASIMASFFLLWPLTTLATFSGLVEFLIALVGLGVAVDYTLLCVTRWREERARGATNEAAVVVAMTTAGRAVVLSGVTVGVGLLSLIALPAPFLRTTGIGGALIPLVSVLSAITLTPAILGGIGPRLDWPHRAPRRAPGRGWRWWATQIARRPVAFVIGSVVLLGGLTLAMFALNVGEPRADALASAGPPYRTLSYLTEHEVPSGVLSPIEVPVRTAVAGEVSRRLAAIPGIRAVVSSPSPTAATHLVDLVAVPQDETVNSSTTATVTRVRDAVDGEHGVFGVAGAGATQLDFKSAVYGHFPLMLTVIALLTFALLARSFRSPVLALKAVVLNLVSLGATLGGMVLFWQEGHGSKSVFGVPATGAITFWVPLIVFAFLFGLSMDYEVFILARIREEFDTRRSTTAAVVEGIARTGKLVTAAALILFLAFVAMAAGPGTDLKVMATGLGFGILLDAVIVRAALLPGLVMLLGRANWWWPSGSRPTNRRARTPEPERVLN